MPSFSDGPFLGTVGGGRFLSLARSCPVPTRYPRRPGKTRVNILNTRAEPKGCLSPHGQLIGVIGFGLKNRLDQVDRFERVILIWAQRLALYVGLNGQESVGINSLFQIPSGG